MKKHINSIISLTLSLIIAIGVLFYVYSPSENADAASGVPNYRDNAFTGNYLLIDSFENTTIAPNGGTRGLSYHYFSSNIGINHTVKDNVVRAVKGVGKMQIGTDFKNPPNGSNTACSVWGKISYGTAYNLSAYDTIELHFYMSCSYFSKNPTVSFPLQVSFCNNNGETGANRTIELSGNTENNCNNKWGKVTLKKTAGSSSISKGSSDGSFGCETTTDWSAINSISFRALGNYSNGKKSDYGVMNLFIDYIVAYNSSFTGPTFESFESLNSTSDGDYLSHRVYPSARGWDSTDNSSMTLDSSNALEGSYSLSCVEPNNIFRNGEVAYSRYWGPQIYIRLKKTFDMSTWDLFEFDVYLGTIGSTLAARNDVDLHINLISGSKSQNTSYGEDDGFNYSFSLSTLISGWNTISVKKKDFSQATNPETKWKYIDGIAIRISSPTTSLQSSLTGVTTGTGWALSLAFDDFRGEDTDHLTSNGVKKITDTNAYGDYGFIYSNFVGLTTPAFVNTSRPDGTSTKCVNWKTGATTSSSQQTDSWKYFGMYLPTARDLSKATHLLLTFKAEHLPTTGKLQVNLCTNRYGVVNPSTGGRRFSMDGRNYDKAISADVKEGVWNKLYLPISDFGDATAGTNSNLGTVRFIRISLIDHQGQYLHLVIGDIEFIESAIDENKMPVVDTFYSGSSTASRRSHYSYCTTSKVYNSSTYSKAFVDENGKTLLAQDNNYVQCVTSSGTMKETYSGSGHFVNSHIYLQYKKPKDFTPYSTIEIDFYSTKSFSGVDGTFEVNLTAGDYLEYPNGYDIRLALSNIKSGWNRLRLSRYYLQNVGGPREGNERTSFESIPLADWRNITGISISIYIIKRGVSTMATTPMTLAIDTIYATNHTYHNAAKPVYNIINEMHTQLSTGWNSPNQFSHASSPDLRDRYEDMLDEIDTINNNKTWLTKTYPPTYYGDSVPNGITVPAKADDGYDYKLLNVIPPEYQTKLDFIKMELEKNYSMSLNYKMIAGSQYTAPLSTANSSSASVTSNSSYTIQIDMTISSTSNYYSGTLTGGIDPILYLTLTGETGHRNFPANTLLTLRRKNGNNYENYKLRITKDIASSRGSVKFSEFSLETATSGAAKWSEYKNSFPARGSTTTWLLIVDFSECAVADRLGANTYLTNIWISETDTVSGSSGNTYRAVMPYTYISNARTHSLTAGISGGTNVSSTQTFNQNSKMTVSGNMTVGSITTVSGASATATDSYNANRTCTIVGTLHNSSGTQINIPKGTTITSKLGDSSKNATIRLGKYIYTGYALSSTSAATTAYSFDINLGTASELLSAGTYTLKVAMYNGYDSTHPFSGNLIDTKTLTFKIVRNEFYATIPNTETLVDLSKASNILNLTTSAGLVSNAKAQIELQKKGVDGAYSTVAISGKYSIAPTYATADSNGTSYTLTSSGLNATFPVTLTSSGLTAGSTYRLRFTMTNTDGSKTYHYAGFVTAK